MSANNKIRFQFDFSRAAAEHIDKMQVEIGASTRAQVVRAALACFEWIIEKDKQGFVIAAVDKDLANEKRLDSLHTFWQITG